MNSVSLLIAIFITLGYILHSTTHPEDAVAGSSSEHFTPSLWLYFIPAHAAHFPYNIFSPFVSAFVESSIVIALICVATLVLVGFPFERNLSSILPSSNLSSVGFVFAKVFLLSHGTFLFMSFLSATLATALFPSSTHPHPEKEKHELEETMKIGFAYFGPLSFSTGIAVAAWSTSIRNEENNAEADSVSFFSALSSNSVSTSSKQNGADFSLTQVRFLPFYLVSLALVRDLFFGDHAPTHSEFMQGIATRGPLFLGVFCGMWATWFYFRYFEGRTEFDKNSGTVSTSYGTISGRFAFHRCVPIPFVAEKVLLPLGSFLFSKILKTCCLNTTVGTQIEVRWSEFQSGNNTTGHQQQQQQVNYLNTAVPPVGTTVVTIPSNQQQQQQNQPKFAPLPGSTSADADRRRELAMAALQQRLAANNNNNNVSSELAAFSSGSGVNVVQTTQLQRRGVENHSASISSIRELNPASQQETPQTQSLTLTPVATPSFK